ncbi:hypothetical protein SRRS_43660 [Sporomusa rhizae]|uniref:hypothetical protein n=1 Tax=Sporomusa rhizae TaxID=357999 RepID=UPI00352A08DF
MGRYVLILTQKLLVLKISRDGLRLLKKLRFCKLEHGGIRVCRSVFPKKMDFFSGFGRFLDSSGWQCWLHARVALLVLVNGMWLVRAR